MIRDKSGFSLMELMIIIAIVSILALLATPGFMSWRANSKLNDAVVNLKGDINQARMRAVRERDNVVIQLAVGGDNTRYQVFVDDGNGGGTVGNGTRDGNETILQNRSLSEVVINTTDTTFANETFWFTSRGIPEDSNSPVGSFSTEEIVLEIPGFKTKTFTINRIGRVTVQ